MCNLSSLNYLILVLLFASWAFMLAYCTFDKAKEFFSFLRRRFKSVEAIPPKEEGIAIIKETPIIYYGDGAHCLLERLEEIDLEGGIIKRKVKVHMWLAKSENVTNADKYVASGIENFVWCSRFTAAAIFKSRNAVLSFLNIYKLDNRNVFIRPLAKSSQ